MESRWSAIRSDKNGSLPLALNYRTDCPLQKSVRAFRESKPVECPVILVPLDCEDRSERLLARAAQFARRIGGQLVLLHVYQEKLYAPAHTTPAGLKEANDGLRKAAEERLDRIKSVNPDDATVRGARALVAGGELPQQIVRMAKDVDAEMIVVSTHTYSRWRHLFLGSKAEGILHLARCPVVVLHVDDEAS